MRASRASPLAALVGAPLRWTVCVGAAEPRLGRNQRSQIAGSRASRTHSRGSERGELLSDRGRELEPVAAAGGADHHSAAQLADETLVFHTRVDASLRADRLGIDAR